jgi:hypothetical protein
MRPPLMKGSWTIAGVVILGLVIGIAEACSGGAAGSHETSADAAATGTGSSTLAPGTGTLSGALAFSVGKVIMTTATPSGTCGGTDMPGTGVVPAVAISFAESGFAAQNICNTNVGLPTAGTNNVLDLEVATPQWATYPGMLTDPLVPGTYTISDEQKRNEDLCKLRAGGTAYLQIYPWGNGSLANAVSGTVTIDGIAAGSVTGRFDVQMSQAFGPNAGAAPKSLSGAFNATVCP